MRIGDSRRSSAVRKPCFRYASNKRGGKRKGSRANVSRIRRIGLGDYSPEKAGVGGSTPSLATISLNGLENPLKISRL